MSEVHRMNQSRITDKIRPVVKLVSMTSNPIGTLFTVWYGSRHKINVDPNDIEIMYKVNIYDPDNQISDNSRLIEAAKLICSEYPEHAGADGKDYKNVIYKVCKQALELDLPCDECVSFTFEIDNNTVAWREQLVRSHFSQEWIQTSRTMDMSTMDINMSDSIELFGGEEAVKIYKDAAATIREAYDKLKELGVPSEDIRLQPQSHVERSYWMVNIRALLKTLRQRSGWIAQASLWTPIISGVCKELRDHDFFDLIEDLIGKPPVEVVKNESGKYEVASYNKIAECEDRYYGRDPLPVDPLYLAFSKLPMPECTNVKMYDYMKSMFIQIWSDEYLEVLGWDRQDPDHLGYYDRPKFTE